MTINCKGTLIDLSAAKVMGILNITPDSFYDGGKYKDPRSILNQTEKMLTEGATFIDVGAYSSRPGADHIGEDEELLRILPILQLLSTKFPEAILSVDTFRSRVAKECLESGAALINDISGGFLDPKILDVIADFQVPYILMHMKGTPQNMKEKTDYKDILKEVIHYFAERVSLAREKKINDIVIDPGFGFSKTAQQSFTLLRHLDLLKALELPVLVGVSRKSMIYRTLKTTPQHALNGTTALHMVALQNGANVLRVHDVKEAIECIRLHDKLQTVSPA